MSDASPPAANGWGRKTRRLISTLDATTPVADLDDAENSDRKAVVLMNDEERHTLARRIEQDVWLFAQIDRRGARTRVWDHRWVRISAVVGAIAGIATFFYAIFSVLATLHSLGH